MVECLLQGKKDKASSSYDDDQGGEMVDFEMASSAQCKEEDPKKIHFYRFFKKAASDKEVSISLV